MAKWDLWLHPWNIYCVNENLQPDVFFSFQPRKQNCFGFFFRKRSDTFIIIIFMEAINDRGKKLLKPQLQLMERRERCTFFLHSVCHFFNYEKTTPISKSCFHFFPVLMSPCHQLSKVITMKLFIYINTREKRCSLGGVWSSQSELTLKRAIIPKLRNIFCIFSYILWLKKDKSSEIAAKRTAASSL